EVCYKWPNQAVSLTETVEARLGWHDMPPVAPRIECDAPVHPPPTSPPLDYIL
ncbi:hypothetical protein HAX54_037029, partial [Datura stramonium]|nr:hypothetical protein [Datura stramonium]